MKMSEFFMPTLRQDPADAEVVSHKLMIRAGMIRRLASGLYTWLPLGWRILSRVESVVREEMQRVGALPMLMPMVQPAELWQESGRWEQYGRELCRLKDRHDREFCLGPTHEEVITDLVRQTITSYKQLPLTLYQIQTKFRDEIRPRFGIMRAREFVMKDAYSFHMNTDSLTETYQRMRAAYCKIFSRLGLDYRVVKADSGSIGGDVSEEFHVIAESGEDSILYSDKGEYAANTEITEQLGLQEGDASPDGSGKLCLARGIEVGHIFQLGDKYTTAMHVGVLDETGRHQPIQMGCYGVGVSRIVAAAIEQAHDARGCCWSEQMAPFQLALIPMNMHKSPRVQEKALELYAALLAAGVDVIIDDRAERPGVKFADMDLIGVPHRLVLGERGIDAGEIEYKSRSKEDIQMWPLAETVARVQAVLQG